MLQNEKIIELHDEGFPGLLSPLDSRQWKFRQSEIQVQTIPKKYVNFKHGDKNGLKYPINIAFRGLSFSNAVEDWVGIQILFVCCAGDMEVHSMSI